MSRQLRIEYAGASYHVYSRGNQKQPIFLSDEDRYYFLKILGDAHGKFGITFQAYCLMSNHYHLSASTPVGGLSRAMHFSNSSYSTYLNRKHKRCGHLFQGRFRSVLVEASSYSYELSRYIHLNPVRGGLASTPDEYPWSSYSEYCGTRVPYPWLDTTLILGRHDSNRAQLRETYKAFVMAGIGGKAPLGYHESKRTGILGSSEFVDTIRRNYLKGQEERRDREKPQLEFYRNRIPLPEILELTERALGLQNRLVKCAAIYVSHRRADYTLTEIAAFFGMSISGISNSRQRAEKEIVQNAAFARVIEEISHGARGCSDRKGQT